MSCESINPNDGKVLKSFEHFSTAQLDRSLAKADHCFQVWRRTSYADRAALLSHAAVLLRSRVEAFAKLAVMEMGKRIGEARDEVRFSADILSYYAQNGESFLAPVKLHPTDGQAHIESSPLGVLFCVEPWNFPYYQLARVAGPQLMAGNVLLVKHAGCVPQCAIAFEKLLLDAGAPIGAWTNLLISHEQANRVIDDPRVRGVALTGSVDAGRSIASRAGQVLKKTSMELGGSDAFIVLDDADLERAIPWAVWGRMFNAGQTCCAAKRFIVQEGVADEFLARFKTALLALKVGDPMDEKTTHGPLSTEAALVQLLAQVDSAVKHGAKLVMGGKRIARPGAFMETTILTDIKPGNPAFRDEFFGPVV
jgi:succinate-semialdehyde dehydrogenase/glutarate-semialdehyde dehydrogenase